MSFTTKHRERNLPVNHQHKSSNFLEHFSRHNLSTSDRAAWQSSNSTVKSTCCKQELQQYHDQLIYKRLRAYASDQMHCSAWCTCTVRSYSQHGVHVQYVATASMHICIAACHGNEIKVPECCPHKVTCTGTHHSFYMLPACFVFFCTLLAPSLASSTSSWSRASSQPTNVVHGTTYVRAISVCLPTSLTPVIDLNFA